MSKQSLQAPEQQPAPRATSENIAKENLTEVQWHFAIPVYTKLIPEFAERKGTLIDLINTYCGAQETAKPNCVNSWQSATDLHLLQDNETIQWLTQTVGVMAKDCISSRNPQWTNFDIMMDACWANIIGTGGWQAPHNHYPSQWSGVLYVAIDDVVQADPTDLKSGRIDFFNPIPIPAAFGLPSSVTYTPKDGLLVLFPALLQHMVHPNLSDSERFTIAFNLNVVPRTV